MKDHEVVIYLHALSVISMVILIKSADHDNRTHNFCSTRSNAILVKILLDQDDRANKFCPIICVFARSYDRGSTL